MKALKKRFLDAPRIRGDRSNGTPLGIAVWQRNVVGVTLQL
jgi:hypothetical protein